MLNIIITSNKNNRRKVYYYYIIILVDFFLGAQFARPLRLDDGMFKSDYHREYSRQGSVLSIVQGCTE